MCFLASIVILMVAILRIPEIFKIVSYLDGLLNNVCACLTLSVRTEYIYSVASHASRPDRVLILRNFHNVVK
jgi:hypothetical protein